MLYYKVVNKEGVKGVFECENFDDFLEVRQKYVEDNDEIQQINQDEFQKLLNELESDKDYKSNTQSYNYTYSSSSDDEPRYSNTELKIMLLNWFKSYSKEVPSIETLETYYKWFRQE